MRYKQALVFFFLISPLIMFGRQEKINAEQPDQSYGAEVLDKNSFQFESSK